MDKLGELLLGLFQPLKLSARWAAFGMIVLFIILGLYGYEQITNHFYYAKLEGRITILKELEELRKAGIDQDPELYIIYQDIVKDFSINRGNQIINLPPLPANDSINVTILKAISGSSLWIFVLIFGISTEIKKSKKITWNILGLFFTLLIFSILIAWIGTIIPTIINPWVNYILFPSLQIAVIIFLMRKNINKPSNIENPQSP